MSACEECEPTRGEISVKQGHCKPSSGPLAGICMRALMLNLSGGLDVMGVPNATHPYFMNSTTQWGCQFFSVSSTLQLLHVPNGILCPAQLCREAVPNAVQAVCNTGQCVASAIQCKECQECSNPALGCQLAQNHCVTANNLCGVSLIAL
jgi:hypothetical protein